MNILTQGCISFQFNTATYIEMLWINLPLTGNSGKVSNMKTMKGLRIKVLNLRAIFFLWQSTGFYGSASDSESTPTLKTLLGPAECNLNARQYFLPKSQEQKVEKPSCTVIKHKPITSKLCLCGRRIKIHCWERWCVRF